MRRCLHLADVERHYHEPAAFARALESGLIHGRIGYINMQFCGLEMHHNENWRELLSYPNEAIR